MAMEAAHRATAGLPASNAGSPRSWTRPGDLADRIDSPHARGMVELVRGISALLFGRWKAADASLEQAEELFRNHCTGVAWERDTGHNFALWALFQMGEIAELRRRWTVLYREAQERGDLYATTNLSTFYVTIIKLAADERPEAESELGGVPERAGRSAVEPPAHVRVRALIHIDLYRGDVTRAWARLGAIWPEYCPVAALPHPGDPHPDARAAARTAVAAAEQVAAAASPCWRMAERDARQLEREGQAWGDRARPLRPARAIAACQEDPVTASARSSPGPPSCTNAPTCRSPPRSCATASVRSTPSEEARALREQAERWLQEQGIASPLRWAGMSAPGFARISNETTETSF